MDSENVMDEQDQETREVRPAVIRGLMEKCPNCGRGKLFSKYLKVRDTCAECGEELFHHRADDGPAYLTILIVCHIMGFVLHATFGYLREEPFLLATLLCTMALAMSLWMLPRMKGLVVAVQWAKRMHGFGAPPREGSA